MIVVCMIVAGCKRAELERNLDSAAKPMVIAKLDDGVGVENLLQLTDRIYSGGEPDTAESMQQLSELGIKTLISVDGARPNVQLAADYGMRYVHVPIGYDGVSDEASGMLTKAIREIKGPIFVHCHHGRHRGPAAAAICVIAEAGIPPAEATLILESAGTSHDYAGLWKDVANFKPPKDTAALPPLVETAMVDSFVAAMATIGRAHDHLKLLQQNDWQTPADHPDLIATQEALILYEGYKESARFLSHSNPYDSQMQADLETSLNIAEQLQTQLQVADHTASDRLFINLQHGCKQCHTAYRN